MPTTRQAMKRTLRSDNNSHTASNRKLRESPLKPTSSPDNSTPSMKKKRTATESVRATSMRKQSRPNEARPSGRRNQEPTRRNTRSSRRTPEVHLPEPSEAPRNGGRPKRSVQMRDSQTTTTTMTLRPRSSHAQAQRRNGQMVLRQGPKSPRLQTHGLQPSHRPTVSRSSGHSGRMNGSGRGRIAAEPLMTTSGARRMFLLSTCAPPIKKARTTAIIVPLVPFALSAPSAPSGPSTSSMPSVPPVPLSDNSRAPNVLQEKAEIIDLQADTPVIPQVNRVRNSMGTINVNQLVRNFADFDLEDVRRQQMVVEVDEWTMEEQEIDQMIGRFSDFSLEEQEIHRDQADNVILFVEIADGTV